MLPVLLQVLDRPNGRAELEQAITLAQQLPDKDPIHRIAALRRSLDPALAAAALAQAELRAAARTKFGAQAEKLLFTPDGLEQATQAELADHRAARYASTGIASVLDLCCGIGADVLAFQRAGLAVTGVELDQQTAVIVAANTGAPIIVGEAKTADWRMADAVFCDPARRTRRGRTFAPNNFSPSFGFVTEVLGTARFAAAKLAPGLNHDLIPAGIEAEWVSFAGGVKETVLWSSGFGQPGISRRATIFPSGRFPSGRQLTDADEANPSVGGIGDYIYEPDGAVIRAGLVQQVAALLPGGRRIDEHLAYLSCDGPLLASGDLALARGFRVLEVLPYSVKRLRSALAKRGVGIVEIKKRGVDIDPAALRRELKPTGPNSLSVLLARVGEQRLAVLAEPVPSPLSPKRPTEPN